MFNLMSVRPTNINLAGAPTTGHTYIAHTFSRVVSSAAGILRVAVIDGKRSVVADTAFVDVHLIPGTQVLINGIGIYPTGSGTTIVNTATITIE